MILTFICKILLDVYCEYKNNWDKENKPSTLHDGLSFNQIVETGCVFQFGAETPALGLGAP